MHIETYDYITGQALGTFNSLDFGDIVNRHHCIKPIVLRMLSDSTESNISNVKIYLENKGSWKDAEYGYFISSDFIPSLKPGSFSEHFIEVPGATASSPHGVSLNWSENASHYLWIDVQAPNPDSTGITYANFRIFYDFV